MESKVFKKICLILTGLLAISCGTKSFDSKDELWTYLMHDDHGYHQEKDVNGIHYAITYKPTDLLVAQELNEEYSIEDIIRLREKYGKYLYFNLSISSNGKELLSQSANREEFGAMVNQLAFGMEQKLNLITEKQDTIPLQDYAYPRLYGLGKSTDMLLVYERTSKIITQNFIRLTIQDLGFGTGEVAFKIPTEYIKEQPQLKF